jgi:hypothetical protein
VAATNRDKRRIEEITMAEGVRVAEALAIAVFAAIAFGPAETAAAPKQRQNVHGTITLQNARESRAPLLKAEPRSIGPSNRYFGGVVNRVSQGRQD